jgi:uncharacterized membrane protein YdjX (TVP38/TMEM64 family)
MAVTAVPVFPLLLLGLAFEEQVTAWVQGGDLGPSARFGMISVALALDILLPVPSSAVITWGGGVLGAVSAALAGTLGLTAGAMLGFALSRWLGRRFVSRRVAAGDLDRSQALLERSGVVALVLTRPLPILAEACVLLVGTTGMSWRRFLPPVVASNSVIATTYALAGAYFQERGALTPAIILSGTIPLLAALLARRWLPQVERSEPSTASGE